MTLSSGNSTHWGGGLQDLTDGPTGQFSRLIYALGLNLYQTFPRPYGHTGVDGLKELTVSDQKPSGRGVGTHAHPGGEEGPGEPAFLGVIARY